MDCLSPPRIVLAGLSGGAGKTICTLGLCRALARAGHGVAPFKKGPDYIDAVWLGLAAGRPATNLDPFFFDAATLRALFLERTRGLDIAVIEGNRGLFDGLDREGSCSTAALARNLEAPVVLALDCTKMTRTAAAVLQGVAGFEAGLRLAGVILNRTAGHRHREILRESIEHHTGIPVLGALPKLDPDPIPERHMGLVSNREHGGQEAILDGLARVLADNVDLERILALARSAPALPAPQAPLWPAPAPDAGVTIGYVRDAALWFYYEENLEALRRAGARLVELSLLDAASWPEIHGLYLGGGFPETLAEPLAANVAARERVRALALAGLPVYAECGGFMYLARSLRWQGRTWPMAGVFEVDTEVCSRPSGLGYVRAEVVRENPFHPLGALLPGHEFHYSRCAAPVPEGLDFALAMRRGHGMHDRHDGLVCANTFAGYAHIHALAAPWWAPRFVAAAQGWRARAQEEQA